ncbi:response regulator [Flavobacterium rhizosphaerae]|uniref:Response regulator n=1 Tax=Flavobacterium rhizosphaerae TaxID=3163298 RepID=A0ABW8YV85_9FLAO
MVNKRLNVLAIDDHPIVLEGYYFMLKNMKHDYVDIDFKKVSDGKTGVKTITGHTGNPFDIALIDYSIPKYLEENIQSGKDLAVLVRKKMPNCKIIMLTMHRESTIIANILQQVNPEGFINKSDCTTDELTDAFSTVLSNGYYYSKTIKSYLTRREKGVVLEDVDIRILILISKGVKNTELGNFIPLSDSDIQKHKSKIKTLLKVEGDDNELIEIARNQGYL